MPTLWIKEFTGGLDTRKDPELSPGGSLIRAVDGHINSGGAFEQRADFVELGAFPAGVTAGLARTASGLVTFGSGPTPTGLPAGVGYIQLSHPENRQLGRITQAVQFKGKAHVSAVFEDGSVYQFDNGERVTSPSRAQKPGPLLTYGDRMQVGDANFLRLSVLGDATDYRVQGVDGDNVPAGGGFFDMSTQAEGADDITALSRYFDFVAVFSEKTIQTWFIEPNPENARERQVLENTGTLAPRSVTPFGDQDVYYLDSFGVRSLRARDSSNSAATTDIGSPIDPLVTGHIQSLGPAATSRAIGLIEPMDGRFWLILGDTIYVFSYFSGSRVSAWTTYKPGFTITDAVVHNRRVYVRAGDELYVYGGQPNEPYRYSPEVRAVAWLPYLDADTPAREKLFASFDASCRGSWDVTIGLDPEDFSISDRLAEITGPTWTRASLDIDKSAHFISLRFASVAPVSYLEPAKVSSAAVHYDVDRQEDT